MNAVTTFLDRLVFAATCVVGWAIFPMLIAVGIAALLSYALLAECFSSEEARTFDLTPP
jgi:hypothetical protein